MSKENEMNNAFQTSKRSNVYRKLEWQKYDPVGVEQNISRHDAINILSLRDKFILSTNKIEKL